MSASATERKSNSAQPAQRGSAASPGPEFIREDWSLFRSLTTLSQKAGVRAELLPRLVLKELADNALDAGSSIEFGVDKASNTVWIHDDGPGIPGSDAAIADLFSIRRPLRSSKLLRRPSRGCLGNGLRVVAGAVLASGGSMVVKTHGRSLKLTPGDDGVTSVEPFGPWTGEGTRVEVALGTSLPVDESDLAWAEIANFLSEAGTLFRGASNPHWYDSDAFFELCAAAAGMPVRELVSRLDGCSGKASAIVGRLLGRNADSLTRSESENLLAAAQRVAKPVRWKRLGKVGRLEDFAGYAIEAGEFTTNPAAGGTVCGTIPFIVEVWANAAESPSIELAVNRTPIVAEVSAGRRMKDKTLYGLGGCGLSTEGTATPVRVGKRDFEFLVNVTTPWIPLTSDGKAPDLRRLSGKLTAAMEAAANRARRVTPSEATQSKRDVIRRLIPDGIANASGNGLHRYSLRQLFYAIRPQFIEQTGVEPAFEYFSSVVGDFEAERGSDLDGMYRDNRGTLYHPHLREHIPLGTRTVEEYLRPAWTFNKILYSEKEGLFPILISAGWPERHDCALLTSKGFASRAARDVIDLLGDTKEPLTFFAIHDADGPGTMIFQALTEATRARPGRTVEIINLGLEPAEGRRMGLQVEKVVDREGGNRRVGVADYVPEEDRQWLQGHRIELNAMSTPQLLTRLDRKMAELSQGKLVPPAEVVTAQLHKSVEKCLTSEIQTRILRDARAEVQIADAVRAVSGEVERAGKVLANLLSGELGKKPDQPWREPVESKAKGLAAKWSRKAEDEKR